MNQIISGYSPVRVINIDQLVNQLYELSENEVKVVEGE
jgi:hypothetical protein